MTVALREINHADGSATSSQKDAPAPAPATANPGRATKNQMNFLRNR